MTLYPSKTRIAIVGGGIAGITAAWQLSRLNAGISSAKRTSSEPGNRQDGSLQVTVYEASNRLGGTVETVRRGGYIIDCGPDGWVTEKPWASELAKELGLEAELIPSNDATRVTYILLGGVLTAMPGGMRMMVPTDLETLNGSPLFSESAKHAYAAEPGRAAELLAACPAQDESIASFVLRHFGEEVLDKIAAPLLTGVFGGDVARLSVRAVMPAFVAMEREHGSLIVALESRKTTQTGLGRAIFTSLRSGTATLVERMVEEIPEAWIRRMCPVTGIARRDGRWMVEAEGDETAFDVLVLAVPPDVASRLLRPVNPRMGELAHMRQSSAVVAALAFGQAIELPPGFGFLVPETERQTSSLMAATFADQKYPDRLPGASARLLRGFFGGRTAGRLAPLPDGEIAAVTVDELQKILGPLPAPVFSVVRRWPRSLPQYEVGHLDRMAELADLTRQQPGLWLLGNAYRGVGLPGLIRDARQAAREVALYPIGQAALKETSPRS